MHQGETILVCGCGHSLAALRDPRRCVTVGVNDVGRLFDPTYLVVLNPRQQFSGDRFRYVEESRARAIFTQLDLGLRHPNVIRFRLGPYGGTELTDPETLPHTRNSPYVALCLALHMGAARIGLIGVDFTDHHFFSATGRHPLARQLAQIDREYARLAEAWARRGVEIVNLSAESRLTVLPKRPLEEFLRAAAPASRARPLEIVSYATTPVAGVPAILARCISACTPHRARCVWARGDYGNGVAFAGGVEWLRDPAAAERAIAAADLVILHNGKLEPRHRPLLRGKPVLTMAHNYIWNVDTGFVRAGFPGAVVGQYQATLPEFAGWTPVPNPIPLWEAEHQPGAKDAGAVTLCYTPSGRHERYPPDHCLYWHGKGYATTMAALDRLAARHRLRLEVIRNRQVPHAESLAMKRRAHIVIDECVTGSYHRNSLEGLAAGCVVVNGLGLRPEIAAAFHHCCTGEPGPDPPFARVGLEALEAVLEALILRGPEALAEAGARNRHWMERHWAFEEQWPRFWQPLVQQALDHAAGRSEMRHTTAVAALAAPPAAAVAPEPAPVGIVIPHGGRERLPHLAACLAALRRCPEGGEIMVSEMGEAPLAEELARRWGAGHVFTRHSGPFERARALNLGAALVAAPLALWLDHDLLVPPGFLRAAVAELRGRGLDYLIPYAAIRYLGEEDSRQVMAGARAVAECQPARVLEGGRHVSGGAGLVCREFLRRHGGLCEDFRGWGGEDNAWLHKARLLGRAALTQRREQVLHHLYHPDSGALAGTPRAAANPHYARNLELLAEIRGLTEPAAFLARFPPPRLLPCPWEAEAAPLLLLASGEAGDAAAQGLADGFGIPVTRDAAAARSVAAAVAFGASPARALLEAEPGLAGRLLVMLEPGEGDATLPAIAGLLSPDPAIRAAAERRGCRTWPWPAEAGAERAAAALVPPLSLLLGTSRAEAPAPPVPLRPDTRPALAAPGAHAPSPTAVGIALRPVTNVYACLVHERPDCVLDLVRNLRAVDPVSPILLYDGSPGGELLDPRLPWERWGCERVPEPRPMRWGALHRFGLDCIAHLGGREYETLTIVDSDQLALRPGYAGFLAQRLGGERAGLGLLSKRQERQRPGTREGPAAAALAERALWHPFLARFPRGEESFVHWSFWPGTVLFAEAARAILGLSRDPQLQEILAGSRLWATEEVLFPTLAALLGFRVAANPCRQDWVQFRRAWGTRDVAAALAAPDAFWMHPVPRRPEDPVRGQIRAALGQYRRAPPAPAAPPLPGQLWPLIAAMRVVPGWLADEEAELLLLAARAALARPGAALRLVEVGAFCGKATLGLARLAAAVGGRVVAIDAFDGVVGARDGRLERCDETRATFDRTLAAHGLTEAVEVRTGTAARCAPEGPFDLALIDGLHDYAAVLEDFAALAPHLPPGARAAFHDYAEYFPGVTAVVDELVAGGDWVEEARAGTMVLLRREG